VGGCGVPTTSGWHRYNSHLAHIIAHVDAGMLNNVCDMGYAEPATLRFVIEDYVRHVQPARPKSGNSGGHHLDQIFGDADPRERERLVQRVPSENV